MFYILFIYLCVISCFWFKSECWIRLDTPPGTYHSWNFWPPKTYRSNSSWTTGSECHLWVLGKREHVQLSMTRRCEWMFRLIPKICNLLWKNFVDGFSFCQSSKDWFEIPWKCSVVSQPSENSKVLNLIFYTIWYLIEC